VKLRTLRALTEEGGVGWGRTGSRLGWLRAARLLLHPDELEALLELDIVKGPLAEARGPASLSFLAGGHLLTRNLCASACTARCITTATSRRPSRPLPSIRCTAPRG